MPALPHSPQIENKALKFKTKKQFKINITFNHNKRCVPEGSVIWVRYYPGTRIISMLIMVAVPVENFYRFADDTSTLFSKHKCQEILKTTTFIKKTNLAQYLFRQSLPPTL